MFTILMKLRGLHVYSKGISFICEKPIVVFCTLAQFHDSRDRTWPCHHFSLPVTRIHKFVTWPQN